MRLVLGCLLGAASVAGRPAWAAVGGSGKDSAETAARLSKISGVVRDAQGVAQMGALVQVLTGDSMTVATAFTDRYGRYSIANLIPGRYLVRASATLFVPATKANLQLRMGATAIVNLTMAALYDTASWLPAARRRADESADDWKWTLRSTANRPILRIVEDGAAIEVSSSGLGSAEGGTEGRTAAIRVKALGAVESGNGGFGQGGVHSIVTLHEGLDDGSDVMLRADLGAGLGAGSSAGGNGFGAPGTASSQAGSEIDAGFESRTGFDGGASRTVLSYKSHPELVARGMAPGGAGLEVLEVTSAQRMSVGERVEIDAGGRMEVVHAGASAVSAHPFLRVSAHPAGEWTLEYRLASERGLQEFDDVTGGDGDVPVALVRNGKLELASGRHQEISAGRRGSAASVQVAFYKDSFHRAEIAGGLAEGGAAPMQVAGAVPAGALPWMLLDPTTGTFRALASGYASDGARVTVSSALTPTLWVAAEYATGEALSADGAAPVGAGQAFNGLNGLNALRARHSQTATLALKGTMLRSGTRVRASYRWQAERDATAVDAFGPFGDQAYFGCMVRQPIRLARGLPQGLEATIDVTNLLAQGYRPFVSADGRTLYFAQAPRSVQGGIAFSF